jgi:UDP-N-acetylmuramyl pentapeptide phosphotransferase/UDP-N-acetylglucosamine-1-phosphate transferase
LGLGIFLFVILRFLFLQKSLKDFGYNPLLMVFLAFLLLGLVDHYFWTLVQGQLLLAFSLAFFTALGGKQARTSPS